MIWGCDPASKKLALFTDGAEGPKASLLLVKKTDRNTELNAMKLWLNALIEADPEPVIYVEEPVLAGVRNIRTTILIAETVGMVLSRHARVHVVPVDSWKKATVGKGGVSKDDVALWLGKEHPDYAALCGQDQDLTDAAAIFVYGRTLEECQ
jgi:Holliday junction resolvasome RuvABC endonuclease subunit